MYYYYIGFAFQQYVHFHVYFISSSSLTFTKWFFDNPPSLILFSINSPTTITFFLSLSILAAVVAKFLSVDYSDGKSTRELFYPLWFSFNKPFSRLWEKFVFKADIRKSLTASFCFNWLSNSATRPFNKCITKYLSKEEVCCCSISCFLSPWDLGQIGINFGIQDVIWQKWANFMYKKDVCYQR